MQSTLSAANRRLSAKRLFVILVGLGLALFGGYGLWQKYHVTHSAAPLPAASQTVTQSTDNPDETPPDPKADYTVPVDQPRRISLPSIGAEGFIQKVGLDQHDAVAAPSNIHLAGWYNRGARPGD